MIKKISLAEVEYLTHRLAQETLAFNEPIPDFSSRFPNLLESCLAIPFQTYAHTSPYKNLLAKAAILFYLLIKNHPFQNGNKRIAMTTLLYFLYKNKKWLKVDNLELYHFSKWVAESNPKVREAVVQAIKKFLKVHLVTLSSSGT